jgi:alpha-tubulin suppressor-like RCC1 family protein
MSAVALASGADHSCALLQSNAVWCWGADDYGQIGNGIRLPASAEPTPVADLPADVASVYAGGQGTCATNLAGSLWCWGYNAFDQFGTATKAPNVTAPARIGNLPGPVAAVAISQNFLCVLLGKDGTVECSGDNTAGELGRGDTGGQDPLSPVVGLGSVRAIAVGLAYGCALTEAGGVSCWGDNTVGQLGDGTFADSAAPVAVAGLDHGVRSISTGAHHACAVLESGAIVCWGQNFTGQLGDGSLVDRGVPGPVAGLGAQASVVAGELHTCALSATGVVHCWGYNADGQLGQGKPTTGVLRPVVGLAPGARSVVAGINHTCAITVTGGVACWGFNAAGSLGDGTLTNRSNATPVVGLDHGVTALALGDFHSCALTAAAGVLCWGYNAQGELGDGSTSDAHRPVAVTGLAGPVAQIAAGDVFTCALLTAGSVQCWGSNVLGSLGVPLSTTTQSDVPITVSGLTGHILAISAAGAYACALMTAGSIVCWGDNASGQLGIAGGTSGAYGTYRSTPQPVPGLLPVAAIATGRDHACAVLRTGEVYCWGDNSQGQAGAMAYVADLAPGKVPISGRASAVVAGPIHTCAVVDTGTVCWGSDLFGQLGDTTVRSGPMPVRVANLPVARATQLAVGGNHTCALTAGRVDCWGLDARGELGDGTTTTVPRPIVPAFSAGAAGGAPEPSSLPTSQASGQTS